MIFSKASGVNESIYGKSQEPIRAILEKNVEAFEQNSQIKNIFYMDKTKNFAEKYTSETTLGDFKNVGENGAYTLSSMQEGYSKVIEPCTWKNRFEVTQEMVEDAKIGKIKSRAGMFTLSYGRTREKYAAGLLAGGINKSTTIDGVKYDTTTADGVSLFNAAHPSVTKKGAQSNIFTYTGSQNFTDILDKAQEKMQDFCDDDGNLLNITPDTIIIPNSAALKRSVFAAVGSDLDPNTANNAINFQVGLWNVLVWPYLPKLLGDGQYFLMMDSKFKDDAMCLPFLDRVALTVKSHIDENTDANIFSGRARFAAGFNNWRCISLVGAGSGLTGTAL